MNLLHGCWQHGLFTALTFNTGRLSELPERPEVSHKDAHVSFCDSLYLASLHSGAGGRESVQGHPCLLIEVVASLCYMRPWAPALKCSSTVYKVVLKTLLTCASGCIGKHLPTGAS